MSEAPVESQLALVSAVVATFIAAAVLLHRSGLRMNRLLALAMGISAVAAWCRYLYFIESDLVPYLPFLVFPLLWLQGPAFLRYFEECLSKTRSFPHLEYTASGFAIVSLGAHAFLFFTYPQFRSIRLIWEQAGVVGVYTAIYMLSVSIFQGFIYVTILIQTLPWAKRPGGWSGTSPSGERMIRRRRWLSMIAALMLINFLIYAGSALLKVTRFLETPFHIIEVAYNACLFMMILYYLFNRPHLLDNETDGEARYTKQTLSKADAKKYRIALLRYMEEHRPYLDEDMDLSHLAKSTDIPRHHLSIVINRDIGENFFNFLARYRVAESQKLMEDPAKAKESLLAICYQSGFKSKSAFNSAFKRVTGQTPGEYRKKIQLGA